MFVVFPIGFLFLLAPFGAFSRYPSVFRSLCRLALAFMAPMFLILVWSSNGFGLWGPLNPNEAAITNSTVAARTEDDAAYGGRSDVDEGRPVGWGCEDGCGHSQAVAYRRAHGLEVLTHEELVARIRANDKRNGIPEYP